MVFVFSPSNPCRSKTITKKIPADGPFIDFDSRCTQIEGWGEGEKRLKRERERESEREIDDPITRVFEKEERQDGKVKR